MSTAIAMAPSPAPHDRPAYSADLPATNANATASPTAQRTGPSPFNAPTSAPPPSAPAPQQQRSGSGSPGGAPPPTAKSSPPSASRNAGPTPKITVKEEPGSPELQSARHRPRRLDLSRNTISTTGNTPQTARPLTAKDGLAIQEVGLACLSPGFVTHDPAMKEQLQRSINIREHQRQIIESRLHQQSAKGDGPESSRERDSFAAKTPGMSRRNKAPPGLSIVAPSHEQFANERVIQSAPLGHSFTGRHNPHPLTRHLTNQPSNLSSTSHIHHVPANQTNNRLPPIADVFGAGLSGHPDSRDHHMYAQQNHRGPLTSPGHPPQPQQQLPTPSQRREFRSAEEAQAELAAGRPDLLPKLVHYGGPHPPSPPSPGAAAGGPRLNFTHTYASRSASKRRRADYEDGASPPLGNGRPSQRRGPFGEGRDSPDTQRAKKDEFLSLCARAWDLFHS